MEGFPYIIDILLKNLNNKGKIGKEFHMLTTPKIKSIFLTSVQF